MANSLAQETLIGVKNPDSPVSFAYRILIYLGLWIVAGTIWAAFSDLSMENGESRLGLQCLMVIFGPLMAAIALGFTIGKWSGSESIFGPLFLFLFIAHGWTALTEETKKLFTIWTLVQVIFLCASISQFSPSGIGMPRTGAGNLQGARKRAPSSPAFISL